MTDLLRCPICGEPFVAGVMCATDIIEGTCHAKCLEGVPWVDMETGEPIDGPPDTFPWEPWPEPIPTLAGEKTDD